ncbi:MAG: PIN domain-containing protein [Rhodanobacter sp.]|jgi:predicted nucleic acid-binding protein|nr:PIN domain-containing protein [Rhodanobacter sp.]
MILADSGFWIALGNRRDRYHEAALAALEHFGAEGFVSTWPVLTEVTHLLTSRVSVAQAIAFIDSIARGACEIPDPPSDVLPRAHMLMRRYSDLPMDLADASLVILAEELEESRILSTDRRDFDGYRWKHRRPFKNLLIY